MRLSASLCLRAAAAAALVAVIAFSHRPPAVHAADALGEPFDPGAMDTSVNACSNFFEYATGTWRKQHPIPAAYSEYGYIEALVDQTRDILRTTLDKARVNPGASGSDTQKIGDFYGSCLDTTTIERAGLGPVQPVLARIAAIHDRATLVATIAYLRTIGVNATFSVGSSPDPKNAEMVIAEVDQGGLGLPERDYYLRPDTASRTLRAQYRKHVQTMLALSGDATAAADTSAAYAIELALAHASKPAADLRDPYALYNPMHLAKLASLAPHFGIPAYFAAAKLPASGIITVSEPGYVRALDALVVAQPLSAWRAYLRWRFIDAAATVLPQRFGDENFAFNGRILNGTKEQLPRWKRCISLEDQLLGEALGRVYVAETFPPSAKAAALNMSERIRTAYRAEMEALTWLTPATKKIAIAKLDAMVLKVGYPDRWRSYAGYRVTPGTFAMNVLRGRVFAYDFDAAQINKPVNHALWFMTPQTVNAYNAISPNEIVLPAAQLQKPFFDENAPDPDNLGATGAGTVGHEMTHGFDDEGHKYDLHGNLKNWWTPGDLAQFDKRANCVIKQFDNTVAIGTTHYQGRLDSGEAIADLGGTVIGYRALEASLAGKSHDPVDGFTPEQRYFLAFAQSWTESVRPEAAKREALTDPHPIPRDRVNNTVANVPGWYEAFNCPKPPETDLRRVVTAFARSTRGLLIAALIVGVGGGFGAVAFRDLIALATTIAGDLTHLLGPLGPFALIISVGMGGALAAWIATRFAPEARGHGVPEVMAAVALKGGVIRPRIIVVKALASAITIGFGGAAGREGPIVQIGSTIGSVLGQLARAPAPVVRTLVACGAAAGISATFNAPIGGVFFASEVILGDFAPRSFAVIVVASVTSAVIGRTLLGNRPSFDASGFALVSPNELVLYALLGVLCAVWATGFVKLLYLFEDRVDAIKAPAVVKGFAGFALVGAMGIFVPQILGVGYGAMQDVLDGHVGVGSAALLAAAKPVATSLTLAAGGSGGVFAPSLYTGAMLGDAFGRLVHVAFPAWTATGAAYGLVGMAALFAAAAEAPITAIVIVFEMSNDYTIILPLMIATVIASVLGRRFLGSTVYEMKLERRGIDWQRVRRPHALADETVAGILPTIDHEAFAGSEEARAVAARLGMRDGITVTDAGLVIGTISAASLAHAVAAEPHATLSTLAVPINATLGPADSLSRAADAFADASVVVIPIVDVDGTHLGTLHRADVLDAYRSGRPS